MVAGWPSDQSGSQFEQSAQSGQLNSYNPYRSDQLMPPYQPEISPGAQFHPVRKVFLTAAEKFWYVVGNIAFGAMYFRKIPAKKALSDFGLAELTSAEAFWYILMCIPFGAGYLAKVPIAKAISEMDQIRQAGHLQPGYSR